MPACEGCGRGFEGRSPLRRYHDGACKQLAYRRRHGIEPRPVSDDQIREVVIGLIAAGSISPFEGLWLALYPPVRFPPRAAA